MVWFVEYDKDMKAYWVYRYESGQYITIAYDDNYSNIQEQASHNDAQIVWMGKKPWEV